MDIQQLKESLKELDRSRLELEKEIALSIEKLGNIGMNSPLVDKEGFPLPDIDTLTIRQIRQAVIMKKNDLKGIMSQIDALLVQLHANTSNEHKNTNTSLTQTRTVQTHTQSVAEPVIETVQVTVSDSTQLTPFAIVDEVSVGSPASTAGIQLGDKLLQVGTVSGAFSSSSSSLLTMVAVEVRMNQGKELTIVIERGNQQKQLTLIPKQWSGVGLLGCHIVPC
jgi:26S proteasome regulatory subunit N4